MDSFPAVHDSEPHVQTPSVSFVLEEFLYFVRGHAAGTRSSDGLPVAAVLHIAAREHSWHSGEDILLRDQVAIRISFELAFEYLRVRNVTDTKKHSARGEIPTLAALKIAQTQTRDFLLANVENIVHHGIGEKFDLGVG